MYMVVLVLAILGGSFLIRGTAIDRHGRIDRLSTTTHYLAQAGAEDAIATFVNAIGSYQVSANPTCYPDTNGDGACVPDVATQTDVLVTTLCAHSGFAATVPSRTTFVICSSDATLQCTSTSSLGIPPPFKGSGASRVHNTTLSGQGSPEATPSWNGSALNCGAAQRRG